MTRRLIVLTGPTASGKTGWGIRLAKRLKSPVISADSRMVYQRLDIGTGKPTWEHRILKESPWIKSTPSNHGPIFAIDGVDHYGLDLVAPGTLWTLTDWLAWIQPLITELQRADVVPIVVGGTSLYLQALVDGYRPPPTDPMVRDQVEQLTDEQLASAITQVDPVTAIRERLNRRRLVRALEVYRLTGMPISARHKLPSYEAFQAVIDRPRIELYQRIDDRLHDRFKTGLIHEVERLVTAGVDPNWLAGLGLEYRAIIEHLRGFTGEVTELERQLQSKIHAFARRQLTWWRRKSDVHWVSEYTEFEEAVLDWLRVAR